MKKTKRILCFGIAVLLLTACGRSSDEPDGIAIQGVNVTKNGDVSVTFKIPEGLSTEEVLGCGIGSENILKITGTEENLTKARTVYWYEVEKGGILTRTGDIYRYSPDAEISGQSGSSTPPAWVMIDTELDEKELFQTEDVEKLSDQYGIDLYFKGDVPTDENQNKSETADASDYTFWEVDRWSTGFSDGYCVVDASPISGGDNRSFILSEDGDMTEVSSLQISNFCNGTALAYIGVGQEHYANAIIDTDGEIIWSIDKDGKTSAKRFFDGKEVTGISSFFDVLPSERDTYYGYFPVEFSVDDYDYTGTYIGILDSSGEWVVEPLMPSHSYAWTLNDYGIVTNKYIFDYLSGSVQYFSGDADEDSIAREEQDTLRENKKRESYFTKHDNLIFSEYTDVSLGFERDAVGFYDYNGNLSIDLSNYDIVESPEFVDGYAILEVENEQGSDYLTVIDTSGKEMFSPLKDNGHGKLSEGIFFMENGEEGYFMGINGEQIGEITGKNHVPFNGDRAWIETANGWKCIDSKGKVIF